MIRSLTRLTAAITTVMTLGLGVGPALGGGHHARQRGVAVVPVTSAVAVQQPVTYVAAAPQGRGLFHSHRLNAVALPVTGVATQPAMQVSTALATVAVPQTQTVQMVVPQTMVATQQTLQAVRPTVATGAVLYTLPANPIAVSVPSRLAVGNLFVSNNPTLSAGAMGGGDRVGTLLQSGRYPNLGASLGQDELRFLVLELENAIGEQTAVHGTLQGINWTDLLWKTAQQFFFRRFQQFIPPGLEDEILQLINDLIRNRGLNGDSSPNVVPPPSNGQDRNPNPSSGWVRFRGTVDGYLSTDGNPGDINPPPPGNPDIPPAKPQTFDEQDRAEPAPRPTRP